MPTISNEDKNALFRQRRFLILISLTVIAYIFLGVSVKNDATYSGLLLKLAKPDRVIYGLWMIWGWALWRYIQRLYELLSVIWNEVIEDVFAEDQRIALKRAIIIGNQHAAKDRIEHTPKSARIRQGVKIRPPRPDDMIDGPDGKPATNFRGYVPTSEGGRKYPTLRATFEWINNGPSVAERDFEMSLTRSEVKWLRIRAWIHSIIRLPGFSEHIAPLLIALAVFVIGIVDLFHPIASP